MRYFKRAARIIYSGVDEGMYTGEATQSDTFDVVVIGSLYGKNRFSGFLEGVTEWLAGLSDTERGKVRLIYAGSDTHTAESLLSGFRGRCTVDIRNQLPLREMVEVCRAAAINCYMWLPMTFHHKLVELLWCKRPILAYPGEHEESKAIARQVAGDLKVCMDPAQVARVLGEVWGSCRRTVQTSETELRVFTWARQAKILEAMLQAVAIRGAHAHDAANG